MNTTTRFALAAALFCAAPGIYAQGTPDRHITIEYPGGTLADFLERIRAKNDWVNIVASPEASSVTLPALSVKNASVMNTLRAVAGIPSADSNVLVDVHAEPGSEPVYTVRVVVKRPRPAPARKAPDPVYSKVFSLRFLTTAPSGGDRLEADAILTAIDTGLGIDAKNATAKIKYHADSGLLFVRGTGEQISMVSEVLNELRRDLISARSSGAPSRKQDEAKKKSAN